MITIFRMTLLSLLLALAAPALAQGNMPTSSGDSGTAEVDSTNSGKKVRFAAIPIPNYNPTFGWGIGAMVAGYYKLSSEDLISPPSSTMLFGFYAENKTSVYGFFQQLYMKEDTWRADFGLGDAGINFQFYMDDPSGGNFQQYANANLFMRGRVFREVLDDVYLGLVYQYRDSYLTLPEYPGLVDKSSLYRSLGLAASYDTRPNVFNPPSGWYADFGFLPYDLIISSPQEFQTLNLTLSKYQSMPAGSVLAFNTTIDVGFGDVPFEEQAVVGVRNLRGYSTGKYREDQVYTFQAEYRRRFWRRLGGVAFAGAGWAAPEIKDLRIADTLGSVGLGLRYLMITEYDINVGVDLAWGNEERVFYFKIGEAF